MKGFRSGQISVLVATDVVGRGIDVEGISHVINYDMPDDPENYVHRIGRTGRMGKDGIAYLFVCPDQGEPLTAIENLINKVYPGRVEVQGFSQARKKSRAGRGGALQQLSAVAFDGDALASSPRGSRLRPTDASKSARASPMIPGESDRPADFRTKPGRIWPSAGPLAAPVGRIGSPGPRLEWPLRASRPPGRPRLAPIEVADQQARYSPAPPGARDLRVYHLP